MRNQNYSNYCVAEAVETEVCHKFVEQIKRMDSELVARRLYALIRNYGATTSFTDIASRFTLIVDCKTSVDE